MATQTPKLGMNKPDDGSTNWTDDVNGNWDTLDPATVVAGSVPGTGDVANGQVKAYIDQAANKLRMYLKYADGTFKKTDISLRKGTAEFYLYPASDDSIQWTSPAPPHYSVVNEQTHPPAAPSSSGISLASDDAPAEDVYNLTSPPSPPADGGATYLDVWVYGGTSGTAHVSVDLYVNGAWLGAQEIIGAGQGYAWRTCRFTGDWTAAQLTGAKLKIRETMSMSTAIVKAAQVYCS